MNKLGLSLSISIASLMTIATIQGAFSQGRDLSEIWSPNPEKLESTRELEDEESPELHGHSHDENEVKPGQEKMTVDVELLAKEAGMSYEDAESAIRLQDEFGRFADTLIERYEDRIGRMWMEPAPGTKAQIQFVGEVPQRVAEAIKSGRVPENISIIGGAEIALADQQKRAEAAARGLRSAGYVNSSAYYDVFEDVIQLEIKVPEKASEPNNEEVIRAVQEELKKAELRGIEKDVRIKIIRGDGPIMEFDHALGGLWMRDDGFRECTSGWSVNGPRGSGIITAAHCTGLNEVLQENGLVFGTTWRSQRFNLSGDVEYHTTTHIEPDDFYARQGEIRDVSSIRSTWTMPGGRVCEYGRSNNVRTCNHTVLAIGVVVNYPQGTVGNLVRVSGDDSIGGDSGGGWSFNNTAWGVHSGSNGSVSYFTPVQQAENILNVTIKR